MVPEVDVTIGENSLLKFLDKDDQLRDPCHRFSEVTHTKHLTPTGTSSTLGLCKTLNSISSMHKTCERYLGTLNIHLELEQHKFQ